MGAKEKKAFGSPDRGWECNLSQPDPAENKQKSDEDSLSQHFSGGGRKRGGGSLIF